MTPVFVIDAHQEPLDPCCPARARQLLRKGWATVFRRIPFTIQLHDRTVQNSVTHEHRLKIAPGRLTTGLAILQQDRLVFAAEITHRGQRIHTRLVARRAMRRNRRQRKTRYRQARFSNRKRSADWLAPSLQSRVSNVVTWVKRFLRFCPITTVSQELACYDTARMQNAEISGIQYQYGELSGYEVKEYLLEKFGRACVYCQIAGVPLEVEHITPTAKGGSNRVSNLTLACRPCNLKKGNQTAEEFGFPQIQAQAKAPLRGAAAVNSTRYALLHQLELFGLPVERGTGGRTKYNRHKLSLQKAPWTNAVCVGASTPDTLAVAGVRILAITAMGHGHRQLCRTDKHGFPATHRQRRKKHFGFITGDTVRALIPRGKYAGKWSGRVTVSAKGSFTVKTADGAEIHTSYKYCTRLFQNDGYSYAYSANV